MPSHPPGSGADHEPDADIVVALPADASGVVLGAPGSGKTQTLVERVRRLVADGADPDDIVVLTPSRQTATALRDRLSIEVGRATAGALARSVASFAFQIVRAAAVRADREPPQLLTGGDEDQIVQDLLLGDEADEADGRVRWPENLPAVIRSTKAFRAEVRAFLAECATLGIDPASLRALGRAHEVEVWAALASFFDEYRQVRSAMRGAHRDAAGLVREAADVAEADDGAVLPSVILVDDAQELTRGGLALLIACRHRGAAVLAFGDPDIGSGTFRGATPENFAALVRVLGGDVHTLRDQHRMTPAQTDLVREVTQRIGTVGVASHRAAPSGAPADGSIAVYRTRSAGEETDVIARLLRERRVIDEVPWARMAVIAHDTRQVAALEAELAARDVPTRASGPGAALGALAPVRDLLRLVELAAVDREAWTAEQTEAALAGVVGGLDVVSLRRLRTSMRHVELAADGARPGRELLLSAMRWPLEFDAVDTRESRAAARLAKTVARLRDELAAGATVHELLWTAWERSRLGETWSAAARGHGPVAARANRDLDAVVALFQAAKRFVERQGASGVDSGRLDRGHEAGDALTFVRSVLAADVAEDRLGDVVDTDTVTVMTPAAAIGVEFDTVVVAGVQEGVWPNTRLRGSLLQTWRLTDALERPDGRGDAPSVLDRRRGAMHDELRLFVRAISRASARVVVTAVDDDDTGPSVLFELLPPPHEPEARMEHPLTLRGLVARHRRSLTTAREPEERAHAADQLAVLAHHRVAGAAPWQWYGVLGPTTDAPLRDLAREDVHVSPSRLHTLEECALNWVISDLGGDTGGMTAGLGTIIHAAMETAQGHSFDELWSVVVERWGELEFDAVWREHGERAKAEEMVRRLHRYLTAFAASGGELVGAESQFTVPVAHPSATVEHGVVLRGNIDRVERAADGSVVIVDLKTGKNEDRTEAKLERNPQLSAYQLAVIDGGIPEVAGAVSGGAKLLLVNPGISTKGYVEAVQKPMSSDAREQFVDRVRAAVDIMLGGSFAAPYELHCRDEHSYGLCRIHTIKAVSSS